MQTIKYKLLMLVTKTGRKKTKIRKLTFHRGTGSYLLVIPIEFVRDTKLQESYIKVKLLENGKLLLEKMDI